MDTPINDLLYGQNTSDILLSKTWSPSLQTYPTVFSEGFVYIAEDSGTILADNEHYKSGDSIIYKDGGWERFGSSGGTGGFGDLIEVSTPTYSVTADIENLLIDTTANEVVVTLPSSPVDGYMVRFTPKEPTYHINNLIVDNNAVNVHGADDRVVVNQINKAFEMIFVDATFGWVIVDKGETTLLRYTDTGVTDLVTESADNALTGNNTFAGTSVYNGNVTFNGTVTGVSGTYDPATNQTITGDYTFDGELKLPRDSAVGAPSGEGVIRYNDTTDIVEFYNGTVWTAVGSGGGSSFDPSVNQTITGDYTFDGELKLPRDSAVGAPSGEGVIRYNDTNDVIEFYNGTTWTAVGGIDQTQSLTVDTNGTNVTVGGTYASPVGALPSMVSTVNGAVIPYPTAIKPSSVGGLLTGSVVNVNNLNNDESYDGGVGVYDLVNGYQSFWYGSISKGGSGDISAYNEIQVDGVGSNGVLSSFCASSVSSADAYSLISARSQNSSVIAQVRVEANDNGGSYIRLEADNHISLGMQTEDMTPALGSTPELYIATKKYVDDNTVGARWEVISSATTVPESGGAYIVDFRDLPQNVTTIITIPNDALHAANGAVRIKTKSVPIGTTVLNIVLSDGGFIYVQGKGENVYGSSLSLLGETDYTIFARDTGSGTRDLYIDATETVVEQGGSVVIPSDLTPDSVDISTDLGLPTVLNSTGNVPSSSLGTGSLVYDTYSHGMQVYDGQGWRGTGQWTNSGVTTLTAISGIQYYCHTSAPTITTPTGGVDNWFTVLYNGDGGGQATIVSTGGNWHVDGVDTGSTSYVLQPHVKVTFMQMLAIYGWSVITEGSGGSSFDQNLNTTDDVQFNSVSTNDASTPTLSSATNLVINSTTGTQVTGGAMRLPNMDTATRDGMVSSNGDMIYNTTTDKLQAYAGGVWVDLH